MNDEGDAAASPVDPAWDRWITSLNPPKLHPLGRLNHSP